MGLSQSIHHILFRAAGGTAVANEARNMERSFRGIDEASRRLRGGLLGMSTTLAGSAALFTTVGLAVRRSVQQYSEFEAANARLRVVLLSGGGQLRTTHQLTSQLAQTVARDLGYSLVEGTNAMRTMMETGLGTHRSMRIFRNAMDLARVGEMQSSDAIEFLTDTMNMFQGEMARTGEEIGPFSRRMSAQLVAAANLASTSVDDLRQAFRYAGTELSTLGYGSRDIMATLAGLSQLGLRGSMGGVRLRAAMGALINPSQRTLSLFREFGIAEEEVRSITYDNTGQQRNLLEMMLQLHSLMARIPDRQRRARLEMQMFGTRSLAAGISFAEFNVAAQRARDIFREMQGDVTQVFNRQVQERMRGFDIQMTQLKESANDLAITFGGLLVTEFGNAGESFGSYMRQLAEGVSLYGNLGSSMSENYKRWQALSPEVRQNAREVRRFMTDVAGAIHTIALWTAAIARFTNEHRTATFVLLGMRVVFGSWSSAIIFFFRSFAGLLARVTIGLVATGRNLAMLVGTIRALGGMQAIGGIRGLIALIGTSFPIAALGAVAAGGLLAVGIRAWAINAFGFETEMEQLRRTSAGLASTWLEENIPVLGHFLSLFTDLIAAFQRWNEVSGENERRRTRYQNEVVASGAESRISQRMRTIRSGTEDERRRRAVNMEISESTQRAALILHAKYGQNLEAVSAELSRRGVTGLMADRTLRAMQQLRAQGAGSQRERNRIMFDARALTGTTTDSFNTAIRDSVEQLRDFQRVIRSVTPTTNAPTATPPVAQDAYIRRGGFIGVSSGDVVVSRDHLASALLQRRGGLVEGLGGVNTMIGPPPTLPSGGGGEVTIVVPLTIDGREIARAIGRANVQQLERGGARVGPEQRRSLRETGFGRAFR